MLSSGTRLGSYQVLSQIGAGGMGEVYRARDTRLNRDVALKVIPEIFSADTDRMARFEREAKLLASLNHPHIAAIYGLEESSSTNALVMELVEGPTLADRIAAGPLPLDEALPIAKQVTEALEYAHDHGVIHRDLKPANIKVKPDGTVKVLDFGLAKALLDDPAEADIRNSPTLSIAATMAGTILGTAAYMSPEQAKGKPADRRADIWAFGVVLFEMLTGQKPFTGETAAETLASVIKEEPPFERLPSDTPPTIRNLLMRCLEKNVKRRLQHIGEARIVVEDVLSGNAPVEPVAFAKRERPVGWIAAAILLLALAGVSFIHFRETPPRLVSARLQIPVPEKMTFFDGSSPSISPNGRWLVFQAIGPDNVSYLWLRALDSLEVKPLPGTDGYGNAPPPFWSPDSRYIAFARGGKLRKVDISGEPPQVICEASAAVGGAWNREGILIFGNNSAALMRCSDAGGPTVPLTMLAQGEVAHRWSVFLPDGHHFLYHRTSGTPETTGIFVGSLDAKPGEQDTKPVLIADRQGEYVASQSGGPGWLLFVRDDTLFAQTFDSGKLELTGEPALIASQVGSFPSSNFATFFVSASGVLVYRGRDISRYQPTWYDSQGKPAGNLGEPGIYANPAISPDGARVVLQQTDEKSGNRDLWVLDVARGTSMRLTFDPAIENYPVWFPDGSRIAFNSNRKGHFDLYQKAANGVGEDELLLQSDEQKFPTSWSHDGRFLLYTDNAAKTGYDMWILPIEGDRKPFAFLRTEFSETQGQFSPDSRWISYTSNESGVSEIYVQPFSPNDAPSSSSPGGKWMVSRGGGNFSRWSADGKELFYTQGGAIMAVDVTVDKIFHAGIPHKLFDSPGVLNGFDITRDGKRFLFVAAPQSAGAPVPFTVLLNWQAGLKK